MRYEEAPRIKKLKQRISALEKFVEDARHLPPVAVEQAMQHRGRLPLSQASLLASLSGRVGPVAPHEKRVGDDSHITGKAPGLDKPRRRTVKSIWIDDAEHVDNIRYNVPVTRPGRPVNARGSSAIYLDFEAIDKAHLELGLPTANGHKASPDQHVKYIERLEALVELLETLKNLAPAPVELFIEYQERPDALATVEEPDAEPQAEGQTKVAAKPQLQPRPAIFTNIPGPQSERVAVFSKLAEIERVDRLSEITLDLNHRSDLMRKVRRELTPDGKLSAWSGQCENGLLVAKGARAFELAALLGSIGWRDKRGKDQRQNRMTDPAGVCFDPGKSGTCQLRLVGELPHDISHQGRVRIVRGMCEEFEKRRLPYVAVIHAPSAKNDDRNWHFHLVYHDRPVARFDGTVATHVMIKDANEKIPSSKVKAKRRALIDPNVQAQRGKWDFEVAAVRIKKNRQRVTSFPFRQRKDRSVTRKNFVPDLRAKLCDLTNLEFERDGIERRVDPLSNSDAGRRQTPGRKLHAASHAQELAGLPTPVGSDNEFIQWSVRREELAVEDQIILDRIYVDAEERAKIRGAIADKDIREALIDDLHARRRDLDELRLVARKAREMVDRLESRPKAMMQRTQNLLIEAAGKQCVNQSRLEAFRRQLSHAFEHRQAMRILGGDLFQIGRDADREANITERQIAALELKAGLRGEPAYHWDIADAVSATNDDISKQSPALERSDRTGPIPSSTIDPDAIAPEPPAKDLAQEREPRREPLAAARQEAAPTLSDHAQQPSESTISTRPQPQEAELGEAEPVLVRQGSQSAAPPVSAPRAPRSGQFTRKERVRREKISAQLTLLANSRNVGFDLIDVYIGGEKVRVALIDPSVANLSGLPTRIEARTLHEQKRLEGIAAKRRAARILEGFPKDYATPKIASQDPAISTDPADSVKPDPAAATSKPEGQNNIVQEAADLTPKPPSTPQVEGGRSLHSSKAQDLEPRGHNQPAVPTADSEAKAPTKPARNEPVSVNTSDAVKPQNEVPIETAPPVAQSNSRAPKPQQVSKAWPRNAKPENHPPASLRVIRSAPPVRSAVVGNSGSTTAPVPATSGSQTMTRGSPAQSAKTQTPASARSAAPTSSATHDEQRAIEHKKTWRQIIEDIQEQRVLLGRVSNGQIVIMDARMNDTALAVRVADPAMQQTLAHKLKFQDDRLAGLAQYIARGLLRRDPYGSPGLTHFGDKHAGEALDAWRENPIVQNGVKFLASLPSCRVPESQVSHVVQKIAAVLAGSHAARAELQEALGLAQTGQAIAAPNSNDMGMAPSSMVKEQELRQASPDRSGQAVKPSTGPDRGGSLGRYSWD